MIVRRDMQRGILAPASDRDEATAPGSAEAAAVCRHLGNALHRYGAPAHQIEDALRQVSARLGVEGQFFCTPTAIFGSFAPEGGGDGHTFMVRTQPGEVDLAKLVRVDEILDGLLAGKVGLDEARSDIGRVVQAPARYGPILTTLCFGAASGGATRFFGGGVAEITVAVLIGLLIGLLARGLERWPSAARLFEPAAAVLAALVASAAAALIVPMSIHVAMLGGLIVLVPGLTLTIALNELATRNLVSGTARLTGAVMTFLGIGFGLALGTRLGQLLLSPAIAEPAALPGWTEALALLVTPLALAVLFRARARDALVVLLSGATAYATARLSQPVVGPELSAFLGALLVAIGANVYARTTRRPAAVPLVPGIMLLVPGSVGFRSVTELLAQDVVSGMETAFTMTLVAVALVTGLLLANVIVPPRRTL